MNRHVQGPLPQAPRPSNPVASPSLPPSHPSIEHRITIGEGPQGRRWVPESTQEHGAKATPGGGPEYHATKRTEYQAAGGEGALPMAGGPASGQARSAAPGYENPAKVPIMPGSETASLEGCGSLPYPCEGLAAGCSGGGGGLPGCGPRGYGFGDES